MAEISDEELEALQDGFDTYALLHAVDELDKMRGHLNDRESFNPPEIRHDLLKLHGLAMEVINEGSVSGAQEMFDLAHEIQDQLYDISEALEKIHDTLAKLTDLQPESLQWGD